MNEIDIKLRIWELTEEIDQTRWELASGAYSGCSDESIKRIWDYLIELDAEVNELMAR